MNLPITSFGMVTSLGHDAATSCAGIRAGLTRAAQLPDGEVPDPESQAMIALTGHAVFGLTEGGSALARWLALGRQTFLDLAERASLPGRADTAFWNRTALAVVSPVLDDDRFMFFAPFENEAIRRSYVAPLVRSFGVPINPAHVFLLAEGRTGVVRAIAGVESLFDRQSVDRVIVLSADSYLDGFSLEWLARSDRLKQPDNPTGLMPGEGGAAVLIEQDRQVAARNAGVVARIRGAATDHEPASYVNRERKHGRAVARVIAAALESAREGVVPPFSGDLICDLNGEAWRAYEVGAALAAVPRTLLNGHRMLVPAASIGDVGAASALVGLVVALRSFERGYATADSSLVTCVSTSGQVGAIVVTTH